MGRRKKEKIISKDHVINFRLTESEYYLLKESAEKADMTPSAYLRHLIVHRKVDYHYSIVASPVELKKLTREFSAIGNNLNQIARYFHMGGVRSRAMEENINACIGAIMDMRSQVVKMAGEFHGNTEASNE